MDVRILYEEASFLAVDKPSGLVVNRADTAGGQETLQDWAEKKIHSSQFSQKSDASEDIVKEFVSRSGIVHRLDKDTSGVLLIAKDPAAFFNLKSQFKNRQVRKKYVALVHGRLEPANGVINAPIERSPFNRKHFGIFPGGREAVTDYKVVDSYSLSGRDYTLLELFPHTGRTHQIRVHMKYIGHPVVSDPIYGGRKTYRQDIKFCPRLFLHAESLSFSHPDSGRPVEIVSRLPDDLGSVLKVFSG